MLETNVIGYVGNDATTDFVNGKKIIKFSVAHSESYMNSKNEKVENVQWISCNYWSESKVHEFIKKGTLIYVSGTPNVKAYTKDKNNELDVHFNLNVRYVQLLSSKKENNE